MKQVIVLRKDLNMRKGKMIAQGCHASLNSAIAAVNSNKEEYKQWAKSGSTKIAVSVDSETELLKVFELAKQANLPCALVRDAGHTELEPGTLTAVGIGPAKPEIVDAITGKLKLL